MLKPDFAEARNNLGVTLKELDKLEEAEVCYRKAITLSPNYAEAFSNIANTFQLLGSVEKAEENFMRGIVLDPNIPLLKENLAVFLAQHEPISEIPHPVVKVNNEIKKITAGKSKSGTLSDKLVIKLIGRFLSILDKNDLDITTKQSQIYRRNQDNLNCKRHMAIFDEFNVIPEFCFGCYKVQVEPSSFLDLIKLYIIFDQLALPKNNTRKCMIEMRPEFNGFYKGFIYCSEIDEALEIADYLKRVILHRIGEEVPVTVKRGCSGVCLVLSSL